LFYPAGEVLLDRLRACHESDALRFIAFANQGHDLMINTGSQLVLDSHRVDFLSEDETQRLLSEPLVEMGIAVHEGALREIYRLTGGHPNFTGKLAKMAVENLNQARRTMLVAEDLRRGARQIIDVPGLFGVSWFSKLNLSEDEMALAVNFAKAAKGKPGLTVSEIKDLAFDWRLLNDLEEKLVLTTQESRVAIRGTLLQMHLESKLGLAPVPTDGRNSRPAVGLFIDLENSDVGRSLSVDAATFAERLLTFSASFGAVVTAHAAAKPWHLADFFDVKLTLEAARIVVAEVPVELKRKNQGVEKNLIDMMINDLVTEAINDFNVSVVVLVTGDVDHYTMIAKSLERGVAVRLVSLDGQSRAKVYDRLAADRLALAVAQGRQVPDFLVWDLEDVLSGRALSATHSGTSAN
jgi:Holliday junction resolvase